MKRTRVGLIDVNESEHLQRYVANFDFGTTLVAQHSHKFLEIFFLGGEGGHSTV